jgi:hypothetical protein
MNAMSEQFKLPPGWRLKWCVEWSLEELGDRPGQLAIQPPAEPVQRKRKKK